MRSRNRRRPSAASIQSRSIAGTSREALSEIRGLVSALRSSSDDDYAPTPRLADLERLADEARAAGQDVDWRLASVPDDAVPATTQAAAYRTALIVIFFDVTLALAGFFGIGALIEHSELIRKGVLLAGSLVVMYMGLRLMLSREVAGPAINVNIPLMKTIGMACVVTWFNPQAIIDVADTVTEMREVKHAFTSGVNAKRGIDY